jgi:hypothetical protein
MNGKHQQKAHTQNSIHIIRGYEPLPRVRQKWPWLRGEGLRDWSKYSSPSRESLRRKKTRICWLRWTHTAALNEVAKSLEHLSADACVSILFALSDVCQATAAGDHRGRFYHSACMRDSGQNKWSMAWNRVRKLQPQRLKWECVPSQGQRAATEILHRRVRCCK